MAHSARRPIIIPAMNSHRSWTGISNMCAASPLAVCDAIVSNATIAISWRIARWNRLRRISRTDHSASALISRLIRRLSVSPGRHAMSVPKMR